MRILVISHLYPSTANPIAGIFVHQQAKALMAQGVEVRVVSPVPWAPFPIPHLARKWDAYSRVPKETVWEGVPVAHPRYLLFPRAWFFARSGWRMYRGIRARVEEIYRVFPFDVIHCHTVLPDGYAGALLAARWSKPCVVTVHGYDLLHWGVRYREAVTYSLGSASKVIAVSTKLARIVRDEFALGNRVVVIPNGLDPGEIARAERGVEGNQARKPTVLSVSNLYPSKGIDLNIRAIERLRRMHPCLGYEIIGSGPEERKLRYLARNLGDQVVFLGRQPHDRVLERMAACTVFSLPSWSEGFGIVYLEAMALGKPVIACQGEGPEDFVRHGRTGFLVKPRDVESLVEALDFLLSHPDEAKAMGERARKEVLEHYTWEKNAEGTIEVYREVLGES